MTCLTFRKEISVVAAITSIRWWRLTKATVPRSVKEMRSNFVVELRLSIFILVHIFFDYSCFYTFTDGTLSSNLKEGIEDT